jgi:penicillin-binding protein 1A
MKLRIKVRGRFSAIAVALLLAVASAGLGLIWYARAIVAAVPDREALDRIGSMAQATTLFDREDRPAFTIFREQRIEVPLDRVSPRLIDAILAIEDQRFYDHNGIDVVRVAGAAVNNLRQGRRAQGGSTITQQLARQSFLTPEKTFRRKLTEVLVAMRLEQRFTKDEILELYLNKIYFGDGLYGVEAASLGLLGKPSSDLGVAEAALLAGLVRSPSTTAPTVNLERAVARRDVVLGAMLEAGMIDRAVYDSAVAEAVTLSDALRRGEGYGDYFKEEVRRFLVQRFGWDRVYQGGLKVYTTIDLDMQKAAEAEVARALAEVEARQGRRKAPEDAEPLQAALVAMDPRTGEVRAMVGGRDFSESSFNRATQARRQPGSAFKPFVYAAALELGFSPATLIDRLNDPVMTLQGEWLPEDDHQESSSMTMRTALRTSSNRAAVRMLEDVGIPVAVEYAERLGVGSVPSVPSLALGSGEVTLLALTAAYAAFANQGIVPVATVVRRVETVEGEVLYEADQEGQRAVSEATAYLLSEMMADVVNAGTGAGARSVGFRLPAAGKTGTTDDYHDAWFVGFTPRLATGVWMGYDRPRTIIGGGYASVLAVPMWGRFMAAATKRDRSVWFEAPATVTTAAICRLSGKRATSGCHDAGTVESEYFLHGTEPSDACPIHRRLFGRLPAGLAALVAPPRAENRSDARTAGATRDAEAASARPEREAAPEQPRRRGFWSRVFGLGRR